MSRQASKNHFIPIMATSFIVVGLLIGASMYLYMYKTKPQEHTSSVATIAAPTQKTVAPTDSVKQDPYIGWGEYCSNFERACFRYPLEWSVKQEDGGRVGSSDSFSANSPAGTLVQFTSSTGGGLGGSCNPDKTRLDISEVVPSSSQEGFYIIRYHYTNEEQQHMALVDSTTELAGDQLTPGLKQLCLFYPTFKTKHVSNDWGWMMAWTLEESDIDTVRLILDSYHYKD